MSQDNTVLDGKIQIKKYLFNFLPPKRYTSIINARGTALCTHCIINAVICSVPRSSEILPLETLSELFGYTRSRSFPYSLPVCGFDGHVPGASYFPQACRCARLDCVLPAAELRGGRCG